MGAPTTTALLTFEEFERLPDQPGKRELLKGELIELLPAEYHHNTRAEKIYLRLLGALEAAHSRGEAGELGSVHHEMGYKLSRDGYVQPDVSITHAGQAVQKYLGGAPAIAIEIISPSNTAEEMDLKTKLYFEHGAREVWRFHPKTRHVTVHEPGKSRDVAEDEPLTTPPLPCLALNIREILGQ
jgi:Uma2 family endonuclease